ncbi:MAG: YbjN domain-containing protein [Chloroflexi bacterium]|nr:YbjN domain-containing protein [Chloroflexota bacterium]
MGIFRSKKPKPESVSVKHYAKMVEAFFKKNKLNPANFRLPDQENSWYLQRGSASVFIHLIPYENNPTIRIYSPILYLPEDFIIPFYRRCLELNMELMNCALGAIEDQIAVVSERPLAGLDEHELAGRIHYLSHVADDLDDKLADEFKAKLFISRR